MHICTALEEVAMGEQRQDPPTPDGLAPRGRAFWEDVSAEYTVGRDEEELLLETARQLDLCESLAEILDRDGLTVEGSAGQTRLHPALSELRMARLAAGRLLAQLGLDSDLVSSSTAQRRAATASRWAQPRVGSSISDAARRSASIRWHGLAGA
jgi:hypothetical protein